ncbi:MAG: hypothetical protein EXR02_06420 [Rhodospirillales bacterium]|nr:hypothetical protein [Rhodospirillales bacterium]
MNHPTPRNSQILQPRKIALLKGRQGHAVGPGQIFPDGVNMMERLIDQDIDNRHSAIFFPRPIKNNLLLKRILSPNGRRVHFIRGNQIHVQNERRPLRAEKIVDILNKPSGKRPARPAVRRQRRRDIFRHDE